VVVPLQGEIWWAQMRVPAGSEPGYTRPVVVVQGDSFNRSGIATIVCVPVTSNVKWQASPGNLLLSRSASGLPKVSVANATQILAINRTRLVERVGKLPARQLKLVLAAVDVVLGQPTTV
jgi:mRNA interferase MazF